MNVVFKQWSLKTPVNNIIAVYVEASRWHVTVKDHELVVESSLTKGYKVKSTKEFDGYAVYRDTDHVKYGTIYFTDDLII